MKLCLEKLKGNKKESPRWISHEVSFGKAEKRSSNNTQNEEIPNFDELLEGRVAYLRCGPTTRRACPHPTMCYEFSKSTRQEGYRIMNQVIMGMGGRNLMLLPSLTPQSFSVLTVNLTNLLTAHHLWSYMKRR